MTVTQGATTKTHVVTGLAVTGVDLGADTVSGTASPGSDVDVFVFADEGVPDPRRTVTANGAGVWTADFSEPGDTGDPDEERTWDITGGNGGMAAQFDNDGDSTELGWEVSNSAPVAVADSYTTPKGVALNVSAPGVLKNDTDAEGDALSASPVAGPLHGTLVLNANGSFLYTPTAGYVGFDSFTYRANDGTSDSNTVTVSIKVATLMPVWRFYNKQNGSHFYTASMAEKNTVINTLGAIYALDGVAYTVNTDNPANGSPLYRFYNKKNGSHFYTASLTEKNRVQATLAAVYSYDGVAYKVCLTPSATTVWRFYNKKNGSHFYTASLVEKNNVINNLGATYALDGPAFYIAP